MMYALKCVVACTMLGCAMSMRRVHDNRTFASFAPKSDLREVRQARGTLRDQYWAVIKAGTEPSHADEVTQAFEGLYGLVKSQLTASDNQVEYTAGLAADKLRECERSGRMTLYNTAKDHLAEVKSENDTLRSELRRVVLAWRRNAKKGLAGRCPSRY